MSECHLVFNLFFIITHVHTRWKHNIDSGQRDRLECMRTKVQAHICVQIISTVIGFYTHTQTHTLTHTHTNTHTHHTHTHTCIYSHVADSNFTPCPATDLSICNFTARIKEIYDVRWFCVFTNMTYLGRGCQALAIILSLWVRLMAKRECLLNVHRMLCTNICSRIRSISARFFSSLQRQLTQATSSWVYLVLKDWLNAAVRYSGYNSFKSLL